MTDDMTDREKQIRRRAHELWEKAGRPDGEDQRFWHQAEQEIDNPIRKDDPAGTPVGGR